MPPRDTITTKFKVDISDLKSNITEANRLIKLSNSEFRAASDGTDKWSKSAEGINAKIKNLNTVLDAQKSKLSAYIEQQRRMEDGARTSGQRADELRQKMQQLADQGVSKTSKEYQELEKELIAVEKEQKANVKAAEDLTVTINNQKGAINKTEAELNDYRNQLDKVDSEQDDVSDSADVLEKDLKDLGNEAEKTGKKTQSLGDIFKVAAGNLLAKGISSAVGYLKNLGGEIVSTHDKMRDFEEVLSFAGY